jgi:hypothetical protein
MTETERAGNSREDEDESQDIYTGPTRGHRWWKIKRKRKMGEEDEEEEEQEEEFKQEQEEEEEEEDEDEGEHELDTSLASTSWNRAFVKIHPPLPIVVCDLGQNRSSSSTDK